jgi:hypothetical protein
VWPINRDRIEAFEATFETRANGLEELREHLQPDQLHAFEQSPVWRPRHASSSMVRADLSKEVGETAVVEHEDFFHAAQNHRRPEYKCVVQQSCGQAHPGFCTTRNVLIRSQFDFIRSAFGRIGMQLKNPVELKWTYMFMMKCPHRGRFPGKACLVLQAGGKLRPDVHVLVKLDCPEMAPIERRGGLAMYKTRELKFPFKVKLTSSLLADVSIPGLFMGTELATLLAQQGSDWELSTVHFESQSCIDMTVIRIERDFGNLETLGKKAAKADKNNDGDEMGGSGAPLKPVNPDKVADDMNGNEDDDSDSNESGMSIEGEEGFLEDVMEKLEGLEALLHMSDVRPSREKKQDLLRKEFKQAAENADNAASWSRATDYALLREVLGDHTCPNVLRRHSMQ